MKKRPKKLSLNRETVRHLESRDIHGVVAGAEETSSLCLAATGCECVVEYPPSACFGSCSCAGTINRTC